MGLSKLPKNKVVKRYVVKKTVVKQDVTIPQNAILSQYEATTSGTPSSEIIDSLARVLSKQIDAETFRKKSAPVREVLKLVGAGAFLAASIAMPNLPLALKPFLTSGNEYKAWKRFNVPYLKRTLYRLEKQKLVEIKEQDDMQIVAITQAGRHKVFRYALDTIEIRKPKIWDYKWRLVSFDIPEKQKRKRKIFVERLKVWGFYPLHESVYLHAYPCLQEIEFLREYLGIGKFVRMLHVSKIEHDRLFRDFFSV